LHNEEINFNSPTATFDPAVLTEKRRPKIAKNASAKWVTPNLADSLSLSVSQNKAVIQQGDQDRN